MGMAKDRLAKKSDWSGVFQFPMGMAKGFHKDLGDSHISRFNSLWEWQKRP